MKYQFILFYLSCLFAMPVYSADAPTQVASIDENDYLGDVPQILTISRLRQAPADAPSASTVIDRETIRAAGIIDLPDVFRLVPGFYVGTNAGFIQNTNHVVSYHGLTDAYARRMQVLIDGRSVYEPLYGGVQWSEIPITIEDIERIEITRGPNAASYGANAFLGTINIITREPTGTGVNRIAASHGNGRNEAFYHHGGNYKDLNYRVSAGYREDDGLSNRDDFKRTNVINARANLKLSAASNVEFQFGYAQGKREEGLVSEDPILFRPGRIKDIYNHFELIKWNHEISQDNSFYIQAFHSFDQSKDNFFTGFIPNPTPFTLVNNIQYIKNEIISERYDIEAQHSINPNDALKLAWGVNMRLDRTRSPLWLSSKETDNFHLQRGFAQIEWQASPQITFNTGAMVEHNSFTGTDFSPRGSINFKVTPNQMLRVGISTASRTPTYLEEKFKNGIQFPTVPVPALNTPARIFLRQSFSDKGGLNPEKIISKELAYLGQFSAVSIDARMFYDHISNYVESTRDRTFVYIPPITRAGPRPFSFVNGGDVIQRGFETQIKWAINEDAKLIGNYARVINDAYNGADVDFETDIEASTPKDTASILLMYTFNSRWDGSFSTYYTSAVNALGDGDPVEANLRFDARLARKFSLSKVDGEMSLNVQNLTDQHDHEFADYSTLRRRAFINVKLDF